VSTNTELRGALVRTPVMRWRVVWALLRGDADLLPHQGIEQRALAHIGAADDGDEAASLRR
jgi:hypothetical protein